MEISLWKIIEMLGFFQLDTGSAWGFRLTENPDHPFREESSTTVPNTNKK
jgi:hypothetical protein